MPFIPIPDYTSNKTLARSKRFRRNMDRVIELKQTLDALTAEYDGLREDIEPELIAAGLREGSVAYQGYQVGIVHRKEGRKLNQKRLVVAMAARGYDTAVIDEAMDPTPASSYVQIRSPKTDEEKE